MSAPGILVTGFGPFPGCPRNVSADIAAAVAGRLRSDGGLAVTDRTLPVDWCLAPSLFRELVACHRPRATLHFGVSQRARRITIESIARNSARAAVDNTGALPAGRQLIGDAPPLYRQDAVARQVKALLGRDDIATTLSTDAGGYLCNALYFHALDWSNAGKERACLFLHLPMNLGSMPGAAADADLERVINAGIVAARHLLQSATVAAAS